MVALTRGWGRDGESGALAGWDRMGESGSSSGQMGVVRNECAPYGNWYNPGPRYSTLGYHPPINYEMEAFGRLKMSSP